MKKIISIALCAALTVCVGGCGKKKTTAVEEVTTGVNVTVETVAKKTIQNTVTYTGEIKASESTSVSAKASGIAKAVYKEVGDYVNAGETLVVLDDTDYRNAYNSAQAAYNSAVANYNSVINGTAKQTKQQLETQLSSAKIEYNNAKTNYDNQKVLYDSGAISKTAFDTAVTRLDNAKLSLDSAQESYDLTTNVVLKENAESAKANVNSAKAALDSASSNLSNTVVTAPISGYISARSANRGQMVAQGIEIFSIKATESVEAQINVTESVIPYVTVGSSANVTIKSAELENIEGTVTTASPTKSAQTGMYTVCVSINNFNGEIKDGMFADVTLTLSESPDALVISSDAVLEDEDGTHYVYLADGDKATRVDITQGIVTDEYVEIASGLSENDEVVVSGKEYLSEKNNQIRIVK